MSNRCNICIEETCKGAKYNCNCDACKLKDECNKLLRATIRITNKCTQSCSHCCFESSPKRTLMMTVDTAENIAKFLRSNKIEFLNLMGGEFFCNPDWYWILDTLISTSVYSRLVSNGDWINDDSVKCGLKRLHEKYGDSFVIHISKDKWHTNKNVESALEYLNSIGIICKCTKPEEATDNSIVPVGRSELNSFGFYSMIACYCHNPKNKYSFLIGEDGEIYKCPMGTYRYANVSEFLDGGFDKVFKEVNMKFYSVFIPSCRTCRRFFEKENLCINI